MNGLLLSISEVDEGLLCAFIARRRASGRVLMRWATVVQLLKRTVTRPRPSLPLGVASLIEPEDRFSFPSGHAAAGLSVGLPIFLLGAGPLATVALVLGLLVGVSRCYLGVHYPFDVLAGWSLAALTVLGVLIVGG